MNFVDHAQFSSSCRLKDKNKKDVDKIEKDGQGE